MTTVQKAPYLGSGGLVAACTTFIKSFRIPLVQGHRTMSQNCPRFYLQGEGAHPELCDQEPD